MWELWTRPFHWRLSNLSISPLSPKSQTRHATQASLWEAFLTSAPPARLHCHWLSLDFHRLSLYCKLAPWIQFPIENPPSTRLLRGVGHVQPHLVSTYQVPDTELRACLWCSNLIMSLTYLIFIMASDFLQDGPPHKRHTSVNNNLMLSAFPRSSLFTHPHLILSGCVCPTSKLPFFPNVWCSLHFHAFALAIPHSLFLKCPLPSILAFILAVQLQSFD